MHKKESNNSGKERLLVFDLLRGYFLFVIIIDHLMRFFGFWEIFTGRGAQWVSAAEGFFFISGIMVGVVRGKRMILKPIQDVAKKCLSRSFKLYAWGVGLSLVFSLVAVWLAGNEGLKQPIFVGSGLDLIVQTLSLRFNYGWADFLIYYAVYMTLSPVAIWLLRKRLWHSVLLLSLVVWLETSSIMGSWQILFFSGLVIGFYKGKLEEYILSFNESTRKHLSSAIISLSVVTLLASIFFTTVAEEYGKIGSGNYILGISLENSKSYAVETLRMTFDRLSLAPARLLLFYLWFSALYIIFNKYEEWIKKRLGWLLLTLGQNSLYVYIVHAVLLFFLNLIVPLGQHWTVNIFINTSFVLLIIAMVKKKFLFKLIPR